MVVSVVSSFGSLFGISGVAGADYSFTSHTFTTCGATGSSGPSLAACRSTYAPDWAASDGFQVVNGIQSWAVPVSGDYRFNLAGARGGASGGAGARIQADLRLTKGTSLRILIGQQGGSVGGGINGVPSGGGGGGTFIVGESGDPLIVAGGGGGGAYRTAATMNASASGTANPGMTVRYFIDCYSPYYPCAELYWIGGSGGSEMNGGQAAPTNTSSHCSGGQGDCSGGGGGGGGYSGDGGSVDRITGRFTAGGRSFANGGGGSGTTLSYSGGAAGGFGGGGGSGRYYFSPQNIAGGGGGGGGYSGGGGGAGGWDGYMSYTSSRPDNPGATAGGGGASMVSAAATGVSFGPGNSGDGFAQVTRLTPATPTVDSAPSGSSSSSSATFSLSGESGTTLRCSLDGGTWATCSSPVTFEDLSEGEHSASFKSVSAEGYESEVRASDPWVVDRTPPGAPSILSRPSAKTNSTSASIGFASAEASGYLECSVDDGSYAACVSPKLLTGLREGDHSVAIRQVDAAGNTGAAATARWAVDLTPPAAPAFTDVPPSATNSTSASIGFTGEVDAGFTCSLDGGDYSPCVSPVSLTGLSEGTHSLSVRQSDEAGNVGEPATTTWDVDLTPPSSPVIASRPSSLDNSASASFAFTGEPGADFACSIRGELDAGGQMTTCTSPMDFASLPEGVHEFSVQQTDEAGNTGPATTYSWTIDLTAPAAPWITSKPPSRTNSTSASVGFSGSEPGGSFECSLDGADYSACSSPEGLSGLADGPHIFRVRQVDEAGNRGAAAEASWLVDRDVPAQPSVGSAPSARTNRTSASIGFTGEKGASFACSLDGGVYSSCSSPRSMSALGEGSHTFRVKQTDEAGNTSEPATATWFVDLTAPSAPSITAKPASLSNSASPSFSFTGEPNANFSCQFDGFVDAGCLSPKSLTNLAEGTHSFTVRQTDEAGNTGPPVTYNWTIDLTPPAPPALSGAPPTFTNLRAASISFTAATDKVFQCAVDLRSFASCTSPLKLTNLVEGIHSLNVRHFDAAGNVSSTLVSWTVDVTPPAITTSPLGSRVKTSTQTSYKLTTGTDASGIVKAEFSTASRPSATAKPVTSKTVTFANPLVFKTSSAIKWIRIQDGAGNWSRWYIA